MAAPSPLLVIRSLLDPGPVVSWALESGLGEMVVARLHVTIAYSRVPVDWTAITPDTSPLIVPSGPGRALQRLDRAALALTFISEDLEARHTALRTIGASWDYPGYQPHLTLGYGLTVPARVDPYAGPLLFGPEQFRPLAASTGQAT